ncbi:MAG: gamma-glutamylcyclotransferase family protein [Bacteroidota bacterium]
MKTTLLFSYGTLQLPQIQRSLFGRELDGNHDQLTGYKLDRLKAEENEMNIASYPIAIPTDDQKDWIEGMIYEISASELEVADTYEGREYKRIMQSFLSGKSAWIYVKS